jgi:hypothetical protein
MLPFFKKKRASLVQYPMVALPQLALMLYSFFNFLASLLHVSWLLEKTAVDVLRVVITALICILVLKNKKGCLCNIYAALLINIIYIYYILVCVIIRKLLPAQCYFVDSYLPTAGTGQHFDGSVHNVSFFICHVYNIF